MSNRSDIGPGRGFWIIIALVIAFIAFGVSGKFITAGYHCHWITVGQSRVCQ